MSADLAAIRAALRTILVRETGINFVFANQNAPRPAIPYGTLDFVNPSSRVGQTDWFGYDQGEDDFKVRGLRQSTVSLNIIGEGANNMMALVRDITQRPDVLEELTAVGLSIVREEGPINLTELEDTIYRERSQMDLIVYLSVNLETPIEPIESVEGTFEGTPVGDIDFEA
jgi:hypothetical protein